MKKIVIDARGYSGTTGRYTRKLIEYLEGLESGQTDREYVILLFSDEMGKYEPKNPAFTKMAADFAHYSLVSEQIRFWWFLHKLRADIVHFTMPQQPIFYGGKSVTTVHDLILLKVYPGNKNKIIYRLKQMSGGFIFRRIATKSAHVIVPTEYTKKDYLNFLGNPNLAEKITATLESADPATSKPSPYPALFDKKFIMYVGQQSNYKNIRRLIEAHQDLLKTHPDLQLVLVGKPGPFGEQTKVWAEQQKFKNVVFTGFIEDSELTWMYQNCQAYVFPSLMEGFGLPGLEAMAHGAPVVSSNTTSLPEVYGEAAHYFDPNDTDDMARAISDVLTDKALRTKLIKNGYAQLKKYSWRRMGQQTLAIYIAALGK